jgi:hypothetical protein
MMPQTTTRWAAAALLALLAATPSLAQNQPLPEPEPFLAQARAQLQANRELLSQYTYHQREAELHLSKLGKLTTGPVKVYEIYPGLDPEDTYRRLIEVDGKPRDRNELEKEDRKHQKHVLEELDKRNHEDAGAREARLRREAKARREIEEWIDDLFRVYTFALVGRQTIGGHSTIVVDFTPRQDAVPKSDEGRDLKKVRGRAWVNEQDHQLARVEIEVLDDFSVKGFLAKLYKGTTASYERRQVNNEVWLPAEIRLNLLGRALVRKFHIETVIEYSDYRKFAVKTDSEFALPPPGGE